MKITTLTLLFLLCFNLHASELVFIVNKSNSVEELSAVEIKNIFLKKQNFWDNNQKIKPVMYSSDQPEQKIFLEKYLYFSEKDFAIYWLEQKLSSGNLKPMNVKSKRKMMIFLSIFKEGIGFALKKSITKRDLQKVKILTITNE